MNGRGLAQGLVDRLFSGMSNYSGAGVVNANAGTYSPASDNNIGNETYRTTRRGFGGLAAGVAAVAGIAGVVKGNKPAQAQLLGNFYPLGDYTGGQTLGFSVLGDMNTFYKAYGGKDVWGPPVTRTYYVDESGRTIIEQGFQKATLQLVYSGGQLIQNNFSNIMDNLAASGIKVDGLDIDSWLENKYIPASWDWSTDSGLESFEQVYQNHLDILADETFAGLKSFYTDDPDAVYKFGLPVGVKTYTDEDENPIVTTVRGQRGCWQQWHIDTDWAHAGEITVVNANDLAKEAGYYRIMNPLIDTPHRVDQIIYTLESLRSYGLTTPKPTVYVDWNQTTPEATATYYAIIDPTATPDPTALPTPTNNQNPTALPTYTATNHLTSSATETALPTFTGTPLPTETATYTPIPMPLPTETSSPIASATSLPPTLTPVNVTDPTSTNAPSQPTSTLIPTVTINPPTLTPTPTETPLPPTSTSLPTATFTPLPTPTPIPTSTSLPTATFTPLPTPTPIPTATSTPLPTATPIPPTPTSRRGILPPTPTP